VGWREDNKAELEEDDRNKNQGWYRSEAEWKEVDRIMTCPPPFDLMSWGFDETEHGQDQENPGEDDDHLEDEDIATGTF
jgi:hypothetical protein